MSAWDWDLQRGHLEWAGTIGPMLGLCSGQFPNTHEAFLKCVHSEDRELVRNAVQRALEGSADYAIEHRILRPDGNERWVAQTGEVIRKGGVPVRLVGVIQDISERRAQQQEMLRKNRQLEVAYCDISRAHDDLGGWGDSAVQQPADPPSPSAPAPL